LHTVDVSDTTDGAAGTSKRTSVQKIVDVVIGEIITPDLQEVTDEGNTTTNDINLDESAVIFNSGSKLKNGTLDNGFGGGISQECSVGYEQEWENGVQYYFPLSTGLPDGVVYANSINGLVPDATFDRTKGYLIGSRYRLLNTGYEYLCLSATEGVAVWELVHNADWDAVSGPQEILNKPTIPATIVESVISGTNVNVDNTDPSNPIINSLADRYKTSSTTSNSVSNGTKNFTVDTNLAYIPLQEILVVYDPSNHMHGEVTSYNSATGALVVDIKNHTGSGTYTSWVLNLDGTPVDAITGSGTVNEIAYFTAARVIASLPVATYPSLTELSYVKGVTSSIQTQINSLGGGGSTYKSVIDTSAVTGTLLNTKVFGQLVPANTFAVGDIIQIRARISKTGTAGLTTIRIYINTADSLTVPAATLISTSQSAANAQINFGIEKNSVIKSATVTQNNSAITSGLFQEPQTSTAALTNSNIDWTVDQYIIFAIQNAAIGDSTVMSYFQITKQ
jgi:hypothetical protein